MADTDREYRLAPKARDDLEVIWEFSFATWGLTQTESYVDDLTATFQFLASNPMVGVACDHIRKHYRRHPIKRHMIYYRITPYGVEIMRILHDRMQPSRHL